MGNNCWDKNVLVHVETVKVFRNECSFNLPCSSGILHSGIYYFSPLPRR